MTFRLFKCNNILPLIITPSYEKYEDRALMFSKIIELLGDGEIHFHNRPQSLPLYFHPISSFPKKNNFIFKWKVTLSKANNFIKNGNKGFNILHDLFAPRGILFCNSKKTIKVLSLYSDTTNYYFGKRYIKDLKNKSLKNIISMHMLYIKRVFIEYIGISRADGVIANSPEIIDGIIKYYKIKNKKYTVIDTCVNTDFWKLTNTKRDKNIIFYAGRLAKRKGLDTLLEAFKTLSTENSDLLLVVAGKETKEENFFWGRDYIDKNELNVKFLGEINREEMRYWYNKSSVFVLPSTQEGSPRVVKEAMACGCSVVCTELPGTKRLNPKGDFIHYFTPGKTNELILKIKFALQYSDNNSELLRDFITSNFSPYVIAKKHIEFYNEFFVTT